MFTDDLRNSIRSGAYDLNAILAMCVGLGLAFQIGHFFEHTFQFAVWLSGTYPWVATTFCGRNMPYMSAPLTAMVRFAGATLFPLDSVPRQMMLGMELLHLLGNSIFLLTIAGVHRFCPCKWVRWALMIEGAHLCEHLALFLTGYYIGVPMGISTLFGQAGYYLGKEGVVGYRVTFHFVMNLFPMPFVMLGMMKASRTEAALLPAAIG